MGDPNFPAPMEDVATEYIATAAEALGVFKRGNPQLETITLKFYTAIYRGLWHFFEDHMFIDLPEGDGSGTEIFIEGSPMQVLNKFITKEDSAWKNDV